MVETTPPKNILKVSWKLNLGIIQTTKDALIPSLWLRNSSTHFSAACELNWDTITLQMRGLSGGALIEDTAQSVTADQVCPM